jgi:hypothetical protein
MTTRPSKHKPFTAIRTYSRSKTAETARSSAADKDAAANSLPTQTSTWSFQSLAQALTSVVPPGALITTLAFWFGWNLTNTRSAYFGIDYSALGFTAQDYVLRSPDAAFVPIAFILLLWLILFTVHAGVCVVIQRARHEKALVRVAAVGTGLGVFSTIAAVWAMFRPFPFNISYLVPPLLLGSGVALAAYSAWVVRRIRRDEPLYRQVRIRWERTVNVLVVMIVVLSLFWASSLYASALGRGRAETLAANLRTRPKVTILSKYSLAIEANGVARTSIENLDGTFHYRYSGLRLLVRSGDKYFLLPEQWSRQDGTAIVIPDTSDIRLEFSPGE